MKGKYFSIYLNENRKKYIETFTEGISPYVNKKIDEDIKKFDPEYCEKQILSWKKQKKLAMKRGKGGEDK